MTPTDRNDDRTPAAEADSAAGDGPEVTPETSEDTGEQTPAAGANQEAGEQTLADLKAENAKLADELARARADHYNTDQQYANFVRRSRESEREARKAGVSDVVEALLEVLDGIDLARQHGDLVGPYATTAQALENTLKTRFGVERYGEVGDVFDPEIHEALFAQPSDDVEVDTISEVAQPGYKIDERVLRAARVLVATAE
ncbi:MAG: nucleotide exchange factor GrpE [Bowdeniella nasicola]|nr:nucleotide exchange factor GrpE [Bowdeniella nasicola]